MERVKIIDKPKTERVRIIDKKPKVVSKAIECEFCGHPYLQPCNEIAQKTCRNVKLQQPAAAVKKTKTKKRR